jgi:hypothetical protein
MSAEASSDLDTGTGHKSAPAAAAVPKVEAAPHTEAREQPGPQVESQEDRFETVLAYEPDAKLPTPVVLIWACAAIGLGAYALTFYFPDLALWGHP